MNLGLSAYRIELQPGFIFNLTFNDLTSFSDEHILMLLYFTNKKVILHASTPD